MIYLNDWTNEWANECANECANEWDHWVEDIEYCEFPDQYIMIDAQIICVNNILDKHHILKFQENKQIIRKQERLKQERVKEKIKERVKERVLTNVQIEQINKRKRDQAKRDYDIDEWTRTQLYNDSYIIDIKGYEGSEGREGREGRERREGREGRGEEEEDVECIKKKEILGYFNELIQTSYLFISAIRYL
jgi:hypothetical protein